MKWNGNFPALYPILDSAFLPLSGDREAFLRWVINDLTQSGIRILQYRNKQGTESEILSDARIVRAAAGEGITLILNDWPELALAARFDGVHVGQTDIGPAEARRIVGPAKIVGVSTHDRAQLLAADAQPVDYIAIGPVFATATKANPDPVVGLEGVREARALTQKPLVAIGGITVENAAAIRQAGADSVASISAIFSPEIAPANAARAFFDAFR